MNLLNAENSLDGITTDTIERYSTYWESVKPTTEEDILRRYLFAFTSVHTSWQGNINGYNAIKDLGWVDDKADLLNRLTVARCGMQNARTKYIWDFTQMFWNDPKRFYQVKTNFVDLRNELVPLINGIGIAKVSFSLEMIHPLEAEVTCGDTHHIQLYGLDINNFKSKEGVKTYHKMESHWVALAKDKGMSPYVARCIMWDAKQKKDDSRYWSYVLEQN